MGVWGPGIFENDATADFAIEFDNTEPARRVDLLRDALHEALEADVDDLEEFGGPAIAAAAIIAASLPGGPPVGNAGPAQTAPTIPADLVTLALSAVDRVLRDEPEYAEMAQDPTYGPALHAVRATLTAQR
jgi:hypothetical protein